MKTEELKNRIDLDNIQEKNVLEKHDGVEMVDYCVDFEGNFIYPVNPLEMKIISIIKELEAKVIELEAKVTELEKQKVV